MAETSWLLTDDAVGPPLRQKPLETIFEFQESDEESSAEEEDVLISPLFDRSKIYEQQDRGITRLDKDASARLSVVSPVGTRGPAPAYPVSSRSQLEYHSPSNGITEPKVQMDALASSSDESFDIASLSCYSRRTSVASLEPEYPEAGQSIRYPIISPVAAGVFDDALPLSPVFQARDLSRDGSTNESPPLEPPVQMQPLSFRQYGSSEIRRSDLYASTEYGQIPRSQLYSRSPTLLQATEDLEDILADFTTSASIKPEETRAIDRPSKVDTRDINMTAEMSTLQKCPKNISEDISYEASSSASRPLDRRQASKVEFSDDAHQTKKLGKRHKVHFTFPPFVKGWKQMHGYDANRSRSTPDLLSKISDQRFHTEDNKDSNSTKVKGKKGLSKPLSILGADFHPFRDTEEGPHQLSRLKSYGSKSLEDCVGSVTNSGQQTGEKSGQNIVKHTKQRPEDGLDIIFKENIFVSLNKPQFPADFGYSTAPEILYELDAGLPSPAVERSASRKPICDFPTNTPDEAVFLILKHVHSLNDLFSIAVINRHFYRIYKRYELPLMKEALFKMSPPAWEFREMSPPWDTEWQLLVDPDAQVPEYTPALYLRRYARDIYTLVQLKSLILARCGPFLRRDTVQGLAGVDSIQAAEIDDAFWRIWTFCRIFGCGKNRENDVIGQLDWLRGGPMATGQRKNNLSFSSASVTDPFGINNVLLEPPAGFGRGNEGGLSPKQLYDMTEIWTCLGVLLQPLHGKCAEARQAGIYKGHDVPVGDTAKEERVLEEWTYYVLTLGLSAVLYLSSVCPFESAAATLQRAREISLAGWELPEAGTSRSAFLKEAVSRAFESLRKDQECRASLPSGRQTQRQRLKRSTQGGNHASHSARFSASHLSRQINNPRNVGVHPSMGVCESEQDLRRRRAAFASQIREQQYQQQRQVVDHGQGRLSFSSERPLSNFSTIINSLL